MSQDPQPISTPRTDAVDDEPLLSGGIYDVEFRHLQRMRDFARTLERELVQKEQELQELKSHTWCAYCGAEFRLEQPNTVDLISAHIATCEKHPMRVWEGRCKELLEEVQSLQSELSKKEEELKQEQATGQEVHDYLCSVNPDNIYLSVLESVIQQRGIENRLRESNKELQSERDKLKADLEFAVKGSFDASAVMAKENAWLREERDKLRKAVERVIRGCKEDAEQWEKYPQFRGAIIGSIVANRQILEEALNHSKFTTQ